MNQLSGLLILLSLLATSIDGFVVTEPSRQRRSAHELTTLTSTYAGQLWYPPVANDGFQVPNIPAPETGIMDSLVTMAASWILDNLPSKSPTIDSNDKLHHLSNERLTEILLQDINERNSLVTADFTSSIYEDNCRFKDGSGLDGAYPMKPWILGCKMLFNGDKSKASILEESLIVTSHQISFRFESDLQFRGPFRPQVLLTGRVVMKRNPETGLINSYQEIWDENVWDIVKGAKLQV